MIDVVYGRKNLVSKLFNHARNESNLEQKDMKCKRK
jgi:hypothetical protein